MSAVAELMPHIGLSQACRVFTLNRGLVYRDRRRRRVTVSRLVRRVRPRPPLAFSCTEQAFLLALLGSERFVDMAPTAIFATLLDEGQYFGSIRTMYRLLSAANQTGERRRQRIHPVYAKPELLALAPNEVWSWDITKIRGPVKWSYYHLYVILDIYSRYVVGWMVAYRETAELAEQLIADTIGKQNILPGTLTLHADRGTSMRSKPVAEKDGAQQHLASLRRGNVDVFDQEIFSRRRPRGAGVQNDSAVDSAALGHTLKYSVWRCGARATMDFTVVARL
jgi:putative transposase